MGVNKALQKNGYEFDEKDSDSEAPAEIWINRKLSMGVRLEWFRLEQVIQMGENQQTVLINPMSKEELAKVIVEFVRDNREVQKALIELMCTSPNIVTEI